MNLYALRAAFAALALAALSASAQTVFYGGDGDVDGGNSITSGIGGDTEEGPENVMVFDDFALGARTSIQSLFGDFQSDPTVAGLHYEIRRGVSAGEGGTLLFSGDLAASMLRVGPSLYGDVYRISGAPTGLVLDPGTYFLGLAPIAVAGGNASYLLATTGLNGIGPLHANGNAFVNAPDGDYNYLPSTEFDPTLHDFSLGVVGQPVPEPASLAALGVGALAFLRRRRR